MSKPSKPLCPSASHTWDGATVVGVVGGSVEEPRVAYLAQRVPVSAELLAATAPVEPEEVLRLAAPCAKEGCGHFQGQRCKLGDNLVALLPVVSSRLPACNIRPDCVWWQQQGRLACMRCPQVVTVQIDPSDAARAAVEGHLAAGE